MSVWWNCALQLLRNSFAMGRTFWRLHRNISCRDKCQIIELIVVDSCSSPDGNRWNCFHLKHTHISFIIVSSSFPVVSNNIIYITQFCVWQHSSFTCLPYLMNIGDWCTCTYGTWSHIQITLTQWNNQSFGFSLFFFSSITSVDRSYDAKQIKSADDRPIVCHLKLVYVYSVYLYIIRLIDNSTSGLSPQKFQITYNIAISLIFRLNIVFSLFWHDLLDSV